MSLKRIVWMLLFGLVRLLRRGSFSLECGVWKSSGGIKLWRRIKSGAGDEIKYIASPSGPKTSGDEVPLRDDNAMARGN